MGGGGLDCFTISLSTLCLLAMPRRIMQKSYLIEIVPITISFCIPFVFCVRVAAVSTHRSNIRPKSVIFLLKPRLEESAYFIYIFRIDLRTFVVVVAFHISVLAQHEIFITGMVHITMCIRLMLLYRTHHWCEREQRHS